METIIETQKEKELEKIKEHQSKTEAIRAEIWEKRAAEREIIDAKYAGELAPLAQTIKDNCRDIALLREEIRLEAIHADWVLAYENEDVSEFFVLCLLKKAGLNPSQIKEIKPKKVYPNGISTWIITAEYDAYKFYMAFDQKRLVGTSYRRKAEHPADQTVPWSYIGQMDTRLTVMRHISEYLGEKEREANYTEWSKIVSKIILSDFDSMVIDEGVLNKIEEGIESKWDSSR